MDNWVSCPYNQQHRVLEIRLPSHLVKCRKNYNGSPLETCPFNVTHLVPQGTLQEHFHQCQSYLHAMKERLESQRVTKN